MRVVEGEGDVLLEYAPHFPDLPQYESDDLKEAHTMRDWIVNGCKKVKEYVVEMKPSEEHENIFTQVHAITIISKITDVC